jgi:hypothetical protein
MEEDKKIKAKLHFNILKKQITIGCKKKPCTNENCFNHANFKPLKDDEAIALAFKLVSIF